MHNNLHSTSENKTIKSRWNVSAAQMSKRNINYLLIKSAPIINKIVRETINRNDNLDEDEIRSFALDGFYRAVLTYRPEQGKLTSYAYYYCRAWIKHCLSKFHKQEKNEVCIDMDNFIIGDDHADDRLFINELYANMNKEDVEMLQTIEYGVSAKQAMIELGIKTKYKFDKRLNAALRKAKKWMIA